MTDEADIKEFTELFHSLDLKQKFSIGSPSGWRKRVIIEMDNRRYDIIFAGTGIEINSRKYTVDSSVDDKLNDYYNGLEYDEVRFK